MTAEERAKYRCSIYVPNDKDSYIAGYVQCAAEQKDIDDIEKYEALKKQKEELIFKAQEALYILQDNLNADLMNIEKAKEIIKQAMEGKYDR